MTNTPSDSRVAYAVGPERQDGELLNIGQQCSAIEQKCTVIDYLPYICDHCKKRFCQDHRIPESHSCEKWDANAADRRALECPLCSELIAIPPGEDPNIRLGRHVDESCVVMTGKVTKKSTTPTCARARCGKLLWQPISCEKCRKQFCASHRYPKEHQCSSLTTPSPTPTPTSKVQANPLVNVSTQTTDRSAAAMAALKRSFAATNFGSSSSSSSSSPSTAPQKAQTHVSPSIAASPSTSSAASNSSNKKPILPLSSKGRPELHASAYYTPVVPTAPSADNAPTALVLTLTSTTPPTNPTGRCAPAFSFLDADAFVPPPLFGRA